MENLTEEKNLRNKSTCDEWKIPIMMQMGSTEQNNVYTIHTELDIKLEPQEDESECPVNEDVYYEMNFNDNIKIEIDESIIKMEPEDLADELLKDDISSTQVEGSNIDYSPSDTDDESKIHSEENEYLPTVRERQNKKKNKSASQNNHVCKECNKTFTFKGNLQRHLLNHLGAKPFKCDICKKSFSRKSHLPAHMLTHSGKKPYECNICRKVFAQKYNLNVHMRIHNREKPFPCDECYKSFTRKDQLVMHKRIHTGDRPYACDLCDHHAAHKSNLVAHKRIMHVVKKPYSCDVCKKTFSRKLLLDNHKQKHHD